MHGAPPQPRHWGGAVPMVVLSIAIVIVTFQASYQLTACTFRNSGTGCIRHGDSFNNACDTSLRLSGGTSIVHSKLDNCNSLYHNFPKCQITRIQQIQNSFARAVVKAPKSSHITPILRSLHWLKITERIEYKLCLWHACHRHTHSQHLSVVSQRLDDA